jgi:ubiquinone/menaquinone biosynthesis C-methylase UbiE
VSEGDAPHLGARFSAVDVAPSADPFIRYLDRVHALAEAAAWRRARFAALGLVAGDSALDVGCGTGNDVLVLADLVGPAGRVVGVDSSRAMIAEARRRAGEAGAAVELQVGDAQHLDFPDASFDCARCERTLQYVDRPERVVAEMARVTRPGGRVQLSEPDWDTLVVDASDAALTRRIVAVASDSQPLGQAGRRLRGLCLTAGLVDVLVSARTLILTGLDEADALFELAASGARAAAAGVVTAGELERWTADLEERARTGRFFSAVTGFTATGSVPAPAAQAP